VIDYKNQRIKTHDLYSHQKINFFVMITLLCKGLHNYCTQLCHFESIQFENTSYLMSNAYFIFIRSNPNYSTCFYNILKRNSCKNILKTRNISQIIKT
jgi:hypothetical protein